MNLGPPSRTARRSLSLAPAALVLVVTLWGAGAARADIYVHVMNCTDESFVVQAFDAKDAVKVVEASETTFQSSTPGATTKLHCAGEGKGFCQIEIDPEAHSTYSCVSFHLDSGKWAVVTRVAESEDNCTANVTRNLDSAPSSCD